MFHSPHTTEIYTLSLHDALPICFLNAVAWASLRGERRQKTFRKGILELRVLLPPIGPPSRVQKRMILIRSEEHTSELQSHSDVVCRLLLEKKNKMPCVHV